MPKSIVVFHSDGCGACQEYIPRFRKIAAKYRGRIPIKSVKATAANIALFDKYKIGAFPTTAVLDDAEKCLKKTVGAIDDAEIERLFAKALG